MYIYIITNNINGDSYIGVTSNLPKRFRVHGQRYINKNDKEYNKLLYVAFRKYGIKNFTFKIVEEVLDTEEAFNREMYYISLYDTQSHGYNETAGGKKPPPSTKLTVNNIAYIRNAIYNKKDIDELYHEFKDIIGKATFINVCYGKAWTEICPELINDAIIQQYRDEAKAKTWALLLEGAKQCTKPSKKLSEKDVRDIRKLHEEGLTITQICNRYENLKSCGTVFNIVTRKSWGDLI